MFYIVDFFKEYGVVVLTMGISWLASQWHFRYAKRKRARELRAEVLRAMAVAKHRGTPLDSEAQAIQRMLDETGGDDPASIVSAINAEKFERYALVHVRRRQMERQLADLTEQEKRLRAAG